MPILKHFFSAAIASYLAMLLLPLAGSTISAAETQESIPPLTYKGQTMPEMVVRAQLISTQNPIISSNISGTITIMTLKDGDHFQKGEILAQINCKAQESELVLSNVLLTKKKKILHINQRLNELGSVSELEMAVSDAEVQEAEAKRSYHQSIVEQCKIAAPFSGMVVNTFVDRYQYISEGEPIFEIIDYKNLEIEIIVPSNWLNWLSKGYPFSMEMDETGGLLSATIKRISGKIDPVSHTIKVYGQFTDNDDSLLPGMSGKIIIQFPEKPDNVINE